MKKHIMITVVTMGFFAALIVRAEIPKPGDRSNIEGRVTLLVVNDGQVPVKNADVEIYFVYSDTYGGFETVSGKTDTNGFFSAEGISKGRLSYILSKDDYYKTKGEYKFYKAKDASVENKRWLPWNPVVSVVLKPKKNPISMYAKRVNIELPEQNKSLGFDLEKGDWVAPHGSGVIADLCIFYSLEKKDLWTGIERFEIANTNTLCGVQELAGDDYSTFRSQYEAPLDGYAHRWDDILNRTKTEIIEQKELDEKSYLVFRSRAVVDSQGKLVRANYGKIYPPIKHGVDDGKAKLSFTYYFNPTPNDRNLEFDPDQNFFAGRDHFAP